MSSLKSHLSSMNTIERFFYNYGLKIASHEKITVGLSLLVSILLTLGLVFLEFENNPQKLWVSETSQTTYEQAFSNQNFGGFYRINQIIIRAKDEDSTEDLFKKEYLKEVYDIQSKIEQRTFEFENKKYNVTDLCFKPIIGKGCIITSPMQFWKMNITALNEDKDIKQTAKCLKDKIQEDLPCFDRLGTPIIINSVFGKQGCEGDEKEDECNLCRKTARALSKYYIYSI